MEINTTISHISWVIFACKEKMKFLNQEMKKTLNSAYLKNDKMIIKSQYHLNMARTLLSQVEKHYFAFIKTGVKNTMILMRIKNMYLQRCIFQLSMGYDCYKESNKIVNNVSESLSKSLMNKWCQAMMILTNLINELDDLITRFKG